MPGRKTDVKDAQWIAELLQHGLLKASSVPERAVRELRDLTQQRVQLVRQNVQVSNRTQKTFKDANIKLAGVASDVLGKAGRAMIGAIVSGEGDPAVLADLARCRLREKIPPLQKALLGEVTAHHRFLLGLLMDQVEFLEEQINRLGARIGQVLPAPCEEAIDRLVTIPGSEPAWAPELSRLAGGVIAYVAMTGPDVGWVRRKALEEVRP